MKKAKTGSATPLEVQNLNFRCSAPIAGKGLPFIRKSEPALNVSSYLELPAPVSGCLMASRQRETYPLWTERPTIRGITDEYHRRQRLGAVLLVEWRYPHILKGQKHRGRIGSVFLLYAWVSAKLP